MTGIPVRKRGGGFQMQREEGPVGTGADAGLTPGEDREHQELPAAGGRETGFSPRPLGGSVALLTP